MSIVSARANRRKIGFLRLALIYHETARKRRRRIYSWEAGSQGGDPDDWRRGSILADLARDDQQPLFTQSQAVGLQRPAPITKFTHAISLSLFKKMETPARTQLASPDEFDFRCLQTQIQARLVSCCIDLETF